MENMDADVVMDADEDADADAAAKKRRRHREKRETADARDAVLKMQAHWRGLLRPLRVLRRRLSGLTYPSEAHVAAYPRVVQNLRLLVYTTPTRNDALTLCKLESEYARHFLHGVELKERRSLVSEAMLACAAIECGVLLCEDHSDDGAGVALCESTKELRLHAELHVSFEDMMQQPTSLPRVIAAFRARVLVFAHRAYHASRRRLRFGVAGLDATVITAYWYHMAVRAACRDGDGVGVGVGVAGTEPEPEPDLGAETEPATAMAMCDAWMHALDRMYVMTASPLDTLHLGVLDDAAAVAAATKVGVLNDLAAVAHWVFYAADALADAYVVDAKGDEVWDMAKLLDAVQRAVCCSEPTYSTMPVRAVAPAKVRSGVLQHWRCVVAPCPALRIV
jgi:hypothetical protein